MILTIDVSKLGIRRSELHIVVVGGSADAMTPRLFDRGRKLSSYFGNITVQSFAWATFDQVSGGLEYTNI
jgi:hypothetical protein